MERSRLFVALQIGANLGSDIQKFRDRYDDLEVKWIDQENLHLTLVPPWWENDVEDVKNRLDALAGFGPVEISFDDFVVAPEGENPYMIWLQASSDWLLESLKNRCEDVLDMESDDSEFSPHITVARFSRNVNTPQIDYQVERLERFDKLVLMQSHITDERGKYEILHSVQL